MHTQGKDRVLKNNGGWRWTMADDLDNAMLTINSGGMAFFSTPCLRHHARATKKVVCVGGGEGAAGWTL